MPREYGKAWFSMFTDDHFTAQNESRQVPLHDLLGQPSLNYAGVTRSTSSGGARPCGMAIGCRQSWR